MKILWEGKNLVGTAIRVVALKHNEHSYCEGQYYDIQYQKWICPGDTGDYKWEAQIFSQALIHLHKGSENE